MTDFIDLNIFPFAQYSSELKFIRNNAPIITEHEIEHYNGNASGLARMLSTSRFKTSNNDRLFYHALLRCDVNFIRNNISREIVKSHKTINIIGKYGSKRDYQVGINILPFTFFYNYVIIKHIPPKPYAKIFDIFNILIDNGADIYDKTFYDKSLIDHMLFTVSSSRTVSNDQILLEKLLSTLKIKNYKNIDREWRGLPDSSHLPMKIIYYLLIAPDGTDIVEQFIERKRNHKPAYDRLSNATPKLADTVEWFDEAMYPEEAPSKSGRWFYNVRDVTGDGKVTRAYDAKLLEHLKPDTRGVLKNPFYRADMPNRGGLKNPFNRADMTYELLKKFTIGEGGKAYGYFQKRKYLIRTGPKGGKYLLVKGEKRRI